VERGRDEQPGPDDPQQGSLGGKPLPRRIPDDRKYGNRGRYAGVNGVGEQQRHQREGTLVRRPVFGIGAQPLGERAETDAGEGQVEDDADRGEGEGRGGAVTADKRREGGGGRELGQGGKAEQRAERRRVDVTRARAFRATPATRSSPDETRQEEEPDRIEVRAPGRLHDQQGRPQVPDQDGARIAARAAGDPVQQQPTAEIEAQPHQLGAQDRSAERPHQPEQKLRQRRIDGRDLRVVDPVVPRRAD